MIVKYSQIDIAKKILLPAGELDVGRSGITVIHGANGTGKTLLTKRVLEYCQDNGVRVGYVDQSNRLILENLSVLENIAMSSGAEKQQEVAQILEQYGFNDLLARDSRRLSGGEKRLVCLLRELLFENDLYILDEPTNDLSYATVEKLLYLILGVSNSRPLVIVSHDDRIARYAKQIVTSKRGTVEVCQTERVFAANEIQPLKKELSSKFLRKNFPAFWMLLLFLLLQFLLLVGAGLSQEADTSARRKIQKDDMEIFLPISESGREYAADAVPIGFVTLLYNEYTVWELIELFEEFEENFQRVSTVFVLDELYQKLPCEKYIRELYDAETQTFFFDASNEGGTQRIQEFHSQLLQNQTSQSYISHITLTADDWQEVYAILCADEYRYRKVYVYSSEVGELVEKIEGLIQLTVYVKYEALAFLITILSSLLMEKNWARRNKNRAMLFYQYGYKKEEVISNSLKKKDNLLILVSYFCVLLLFGCLFWYVKRTSLELLLPWLSISMVMALAVYAIQRRLRIHTVQGGMTWKWRG
ncbi:MAG: ATP-binding cassette domain-containing protein [Lachnospiraceae bacterium]|nr:ATP-binding cassette domain-containing protein [Lachnospiraceae bacterium]